MKAQTNQLLRKIIREELKKVNENDFLEPEFSDEGEDKYYDGDKWGKYYLNNIGLIAWARDAKHLYEELNDGTRGQFINGGDVQDLLFTLEQLKDTLDELVEGISNDIG